MTAIPGDRLREPLIERRRRAEPESGELASVERVAAVVPGTVVDEADQRFGLSQLAQDAARDLDILDLVAAGDVGVRRALRVEQEIDAAAWSRTESQSRTLRPSP
jgi:hypothetical protein